MTNQTLGVDEGWGPPDSTIRIGNASSGSTVDTKTPVSRLERLYTTRQAAEILGVSTARVLALAKSRMLGLKLGRDWVFRDYELQAMTSRHPGRPRKGVLAGGTKER